MDSVRNTLKTFHQKLLKEGKMVEAKKETAKAPVEEVTTPEDEEKIKEDLFLRPSPSPTDLGNSQMFIKSFFSNFKFDYFRIFSFRRNSS